MTPRARPLDAELDRDARVLTVPAKRVKTNRRERVSLGSRSPEILEGAQALEEGAGPLGFTAAGGRPPHDSQLRRLLRELAIAAVPTGSAPAPGTGQVRKRIIPAELIESALAHVVRSRVAAADACSDLFECLRVLMDDRARYLAQGSGKLPEPGG